MISYLWKDRNNESGWGLRRLHVLPGLGVLGVIGVAVAGAPEASMGPKGVSGEGASSRQLPEHCRRQADRGPLRRIQSLGPVIPR
jgi:hypothetical protein